jgi:membrane protein implicated in regulation of membrane protease activity
MLPQKSRRFPLRDNGLTIVLMALFAASVAGMAFAGWHAHNDERVAHGATATVFMDYLVSGSFLSALFENWESEFLQMAAYVVLTAMLIQRGSAESRDPDEGNDEAPLEPDSPSAARTDGWLRALYERSLGITLMLLFLISFAFHFWGSLRAANAEALLHERPLQGAAAYLLDSGFWFESLQNWQSEFLSTAVIVVLSIFLRQKGSPESKPVNAPHSATGA